MARNFMDYTTMPLEEFQKLRHHDLTKGGGEISIPFFRMYIEGENYLALTETIFAGLDPQRSRFGIERMGVYVIDRLDARRRIEEFSLHGDEVIFR